MANLSESIEWTANIYQLETTDDALAGSSGVMNRQAKELANRTQFLKKANEDEIAARVNADNAVLQTANNNAAEAAATAYNDAVSAAATDATNKATAAYNAAIEASRILGSSQSQSVTGSGTQSGSASPFKSFHIFDLPTNGSSRSLTYDYTLNADAKEAYIKIHIGYLVTGTVNIKSSTGKLIHSFQTTGTNTNFIAQITKISSDTDFWFLNHKSDAFGDDSIKIDIV